MQELLMKIELNLKKIETLEPILKKIAIGSEKKVIDNPISLEQVDFLEKKFDITLPDGFKKFYTTITNGNTESIGPDDGLYTLEQIEQKINRKKVREPFKLVNPWYDRKNEIKISNDEYISGTIPISHYGGGIETFLVINGRMNGTVWSDERKNRSNEAVIYPLTGRSTQFRNSQHLTFLQWYLDWITFCLERIERYQIRKDEIINNITPEINELKLSNLKLTQIPPLPKAMPRLKKIELMDNYLTSLKELPFDLPCLQELILRNCGITNLKDFPQKLPNLKHLDLGELKIGDLIGLPLSLPKMQTLWASSTSLKTLKGFPSDVPELKGIKFSRSQIKNLVHLPHSLPKLEKIDLVNCNLESLEGLPEELPSLKSIDLRNTTIAHPESIPDWVRSFIKT